MRKETKRKETLRMYPDIKARIMNICEKFPGMKFQSFIDNSVETNLAICEKKVKAIKKIEKRRNHE